MKKQKPYLFEVYNPCRPNFPLTQKLVYADNEEEAEKKLANHLKQTLNHKCFKIRNATLF